MTREELRRWRRIRGRQYLIPRVFSKVTRGKRSGYSAIGHLTFYTPARGQTLRDMLSGKCKPTNIETSAKRIMKALRRLKRIGFDCGD